MAGAIAAAWCGTLSDVNADFDQVRGPDEIDVFWLSALLQERLGTSSRLVAIDATSIGTGQVGENVRFELTWDAVGHDLPASVVGKFPSRSEVSRATAVQIDTYTKEVGFYRDLQAAVTIRTPRIHHVGWNPDTNDFVLIMEDIIPAEQGDQLAGCTLEQAELAIDEAVGLHAPTWGHTAELGGDHDWLVGPTDETVGFRMHLFTMLTPGFVERYEGRLSAGDLALASMLSEQFVQWYQVAATWADEHGAWCVAHGDYRLDNMLFGTPPGSPALTVVDWQTVGIGTGPGDIAYFCGSGLPQVDRSTHERLLVQRYGEGLRAAGVDVSDEAVWDGYVLGSVGGLYMAVLASQIVERTERGDEMFAVMAERHAAQIRDVGLLDRLGVS